MSAKSQQFPPNTLNDVRVMVVDDEEILVWSIDSELRALGAEVTRAGSIREALERFPQASPDVVITDLKLPDGNGLELLKKWRFEYPDLPIILITAHGAIDSAITAVRLGAYDYLQKPFNMKDLTATVRRSAEIAKLRQKVSGLTAAEAPPREVEIVGETPVMLRLKAQLERISKSKANTALILGDSGTGKELAARAVHEWSERRTHPFVEINCASIPETLLESELFGYEKGAFTDARERKLGLFEIARNGTLFLDEIGEMPLKLQAKILRALECRRFKRLGGTKDIEFTGRIVAATNRDLIREVAAGRFRADLYFRLNVLPVKIPPLRARPDDIERLARFFCAALASELGLKAPLVSQAALTALRAHDWPGNIRELRNVLQRAMVYHEPDTVLPEHLDIEAWPDFAIDAPRAAEPRTLAMPPSTPAAWASSNVAVSAPAPFAAPSLALSRLEETAAASDGVPPWLILPDCGVNLDAVEKSLLIQALKKFPRNQTKAAGLLGISRHTLRYRLEKHHLELTGDGELREIAADATL